MVDVINGTFLSSVVICQETSNMVDVINGTFLMVDVICQNLITYDRLSKHQTTPQHAQL
jgi:hypothetical protein